MDKQDKVYQQAGEAHEAVGLLAGEVVSTSKGAVSINKCKVAQIGVVLDFVIYVMQELGVVSPEGGADVALDDALASLAAKIEDPIVFLQLLNQTSERFYVVTTELTSLEYDDFMDLEIDEAFEVMMATWEVNKLFFSKRLLPMLVAKLGLAKKDQNPSASQTQWAGQASTNSHAKKKRKKTTKK